MNVTVFGSSKSSKYDKTAYNVGKLLAEKNITVVNGGYGGIMLAVSQGAFEHSGNVIGVTLERFNGHENKYITEIIPETKLINRIEKLIELGDAYIAFPGSTGTLSEISIVCELVNKNFIKPGKIFVHKYWNPLIDMIKHEWEYGDGRTGKSILKDYIYLFEKEDEIIDKI